MNKNLIKLSDEVREALSNNRPIVALESSFISHGFPFPENYNTVLAAEKIIRENNVTPASIAIVDGEIKVGLTEQDFSLLAKLINVNKGSERDIPFLLAKHATASITAGACMAIASSIGIDVVVMGGIGGVAASNSNKRDISADLTALSQYRCIVICSGTKAFMDIGETLEFLETYSIPVVVYQSEEFPFFISRNSGEKVDWVAESVSEIASIYLEMRSLEQTRGLLVGVPIPGEAEMPVEETKIAIQSAISEMEIDGVKGKDYTPQILSTIHRLTNNKSLHANIKLILNNARVGSEVAKALLVVNNR